jgi:aminoglycoside phosphotransferase
MVAEVESQIIALQRYFKTGSSSVAQRLLERAGYTSNLRIRIQDACLFHSTRCKNRNYDPQVLRAMENIATQLDRISQLCRDTLHQAGQLNRRKFLKHPSYRKMLNQVERSLGQISRSIERRDTDKALKLGRVGMKLEKRHSKVKSQYTRRLKKKRHSKDLVASMFVAYSIDQMGDALRHISESIITANLGLPVDIDRFKSLQASMDQLSDDHPGVMKVETIAETRSGSGISGIGTNRQETGDFIAIFKDGHKRKLKEEYDGVERWHKMYPGLAPKILSFDKRGENASLLIEHLPGNTLESILLNESLSLQEDAFKQLCRTLSDVWQQTYKPEPVFANHMAQLESRLGLVYSVHSEFNQPSTVLCGYRHRSFDQLVEQAKKLENFYPAPFSVFIHGDFNLDNIIYDPDRVRINFIDVHRSRHMDYVQDISVFMVSNYRMHGLDRVHRVRSMKLACQMCRFARKQAGKYGDKTFDVRLALGLARSFATSTRFILDSTMARDMFMRARYLLELVLRADADKVHKFRLPVRELFRV